MLQAVATLCFHRWDYKVCTIGSPFCCLEQHNHVCCLHLFTCHLTVGVVCTPDSFGARFGTLYLRCRGELSDAFKEHLEAAVAAAKQQQQQQWQQQQQRQQPQQQPQQLPQDVQLQHNVSPAQPAYPSLSSPMPASINASTATATVSSQPLVDPQLVAAMTDMVSMHTAQQQTALCLRTASALLPNLTKLGMYVSWLYVFHRTQYVHCMIP